MTLKFIRKSSRIPLPSASLTNSDQRVWWIPKESAICALYLYLIASYSWCFSIGILPEKYTVGIPLSKAASFRQLCQIWIKNDAFATISRRNWEKHLKYLAKFFLCMNWMICSILRKSAYNFNFFMILANSRNILWSKMTGYYSGKLEFHAENCPYNFTDNFMDNSCEVCFFVINRTWKDDTLKNLPLNLYDVLP